VNIERINIESVEVADRHREVNPGKVRELAQSMETLGLQQPITVQRGGGGFVLVTGLHRLMGGKSLGWETIPAIVVDMDEIDRELWEIDENLIRAELTPTEEADHLARRKVLWEARDKVGKDFPLYTGRGNEGFASDTANRTGQSKRTINLKVHRADNVAPEVKDAIRGTELDTGSNLDLLAKMEPAAQWESVTAAREQGARKVAPRPPRTDYITLIQWQAMGAGERERAMGVEASSSLNKTDGPGIEWAHWSWNPVTGCKHNCAYCYARDIANRFYPQKFEPTFHPNRLRAPLGRTPAEDASGPPRNIFTCSMADLFGKWVPQEWIDSVFGVITEASAWNFLCLTKFPQRLAELDWPKNAWVGATVDAQNRVEVTLKAFERVKAQSPAITWLSLEPLLEPLSFPSLEVFDWVVIGGASKSSQTPEFTPPRAWVEPLIEMADRAGCKVFLKTNLKYRQELP